MTRAWDSFIDHCCRWLCLHYPGRYRLIPHAEDPTQPLLMQFMLWPHHLYLQHFVSPESTTWFHRHRWARMRSWVLSGWFVECRPLDRCMLLHKRLSTYAMTKDVIHHVVAWSPLCWTLFFVRGASDDWGYFPRRAFKGSGVVEKDFVPWRDHVRSRVRNLETGKVTK